MVDDAKNATDRRRDAANRAQSWFTDSDKHAVSTAFDERETSHLRTLAVATVYSLFKHLYGRAPKTFLDVGCGTGEGLAYARRLDPNLRTTGIDPVPQAIAAARHLNAEATLHCIDAEGLTVNLIDPPEITLIHLCLGLWSQPTRGLIAIMNTMPPESMLYIVDLNRADRRNALDAARNNAERTYLTDQYHAAYAPGELSRLLLTTSACLNRRFHAHVEANGFAGFPFGSIEQIALLNSGGFQKALRAVSRQQSRSGLPLRPLHAWIWPEP